MILLTGYFATQLVMSGRSVMMLQMIGYGIAAIISVFLIVTLVLLTVLVLKHTKLVMLGLYKKLVLNKRKRKLDIKNNSEIELFSNKSFNDDEKPPKESPMYRNHAEERSLPGINRDSMIQQLVAPTESNML